MSYVKSISETNNKSQEHKKELIMDLFCDEDCAPCGTCIGVDDNSDGPSFTFTPDQEKTIQDFIEFMRSDKKYMVIQGAAGSGKTTIIRYIIDTANTYFFETDGMYSEYETILAATTNQAVVVLSNLADRDAATIHSILGLRVINDFSTGETRLGFKKDAERKYDSLMIIDEGSMINDELMRIIDQQTIDCKIIIIGDQYQLAPVNYNISTMEKLLPNKNITRSEMNKIMRNSGVIMETGAMFRDTVEKLNKLNILSDDAVQNAFNPIPIGEAIQRLDKAAYVALIEDEFTSPDFSLDKAKIVAWTNDKVLQYNRFIRQKQGFHEMFEAGEVVFTNNPIITRKMHKPVDSAVYITDVSKRYLMKNKFPDFDIWGYDVEINDSHVAFFPEDQMQTKLYLKTLAGLKQWRRFFEVKNEWLDLRTPYASTVHKAQGSGYDTVFIDLEDIGKCDSATDVARMLYVSISRAKKQVYLYGELPPKYRGEKI